MKGFTNYNSISGKHSTWMAISPPVTNDKRLWQLTDKNYTWKYLPQQVKQDFTEAHTMLISRSLQKQEPSHVAAGGNCDDKCCHPYTATGSILMIGVATHTMQEENFNYHCCHPYNATGRILMISVATHTMQKEKFWWSVLPPIQCKRKNSGNQCCHPYNARGRSLMIGFAIRTM